MNARHLSISAAVLATLAFGIAPAATAEGERVKSATLTMTSWKVAFIGSAGQSLGEVTYQGKTRKFKMTGLGFGGIGISTSSATGVVYNMKAIDDFLGSYTSARSGITSGTMSSSKTK